MWRVRRGGGVQAYREAMLPLRLDAWAFEMVCAPQAQRSESAADDRPWASHEGMVAGMKEGRAFVLMILSAIAALRVDAAGGVTNNPSMDGARGINTPPRHTFDWVDRLLVQAGQPGLSPVVQKENGRREYRVIRVRSAPDGARQMEVLTVGGRAGIVSDGPGDAVREENSMRYRFDVYTIDAKGVRSSKPAAGALSGQASERWFWLLYWSEVFSLDPSPAKATDDGRYVLPYGGDVWVFERSAAKSYDLVVRNARFAVCRQFETDLGDWIGKLGIKLEPVEGPFRETPQATR